jgi:hypothetical protein
MRDFELSLLWRVFLKQRSKPQEKVMKIDTPKLSKADIERAMITPSAVFDTPAEIVEAEGLTRPQKIEVLTRWELDARALQRATDENMTGGGRPPLEEVNEALLKLDPEGKKADGFGKAPTKI